jgi:hypothetical protein
MATTATKRGPVDSLRKTALVAGGFYLLTFVSIPTLALYSAVQEPNYIVGSGPDTAALFGGILEIIVALAGIGTAVVLYPVVKRQNQAAALGFVGARVLEAAAIFVGVASLLMIVTLRQAGVGADGLVTGQALVGMYDSMFLLGQSLIPPLNALLLGSLMYRSRLVPRILPLLGLIGAPLLVAGHIGTMFGLWGTFGQWGQPNVLTGIGVLLVAGWEFSLGVYLVMKGFRPSAVAKLSKKPDVFGDPPVAL